MITGRWSQLALSAFFISSGCSDGGFRRIETNTEFPLRAVAFNPSGQLLAVGAEGTVLRYDDADGLVDTSTDGDPGPRRATFETVSPRGAGWIVAGNAGLAYQLTGTTFEVINTRTDSRLISSVALTPTINLLGGENGIMRRVLPGTPNAAGENPGTRKRIVGLHGISVSEVLAVTDDGTLLERVGGDWDESEVLTETSSEALPLFDVWSSTVGGDVWTVGLGGRSFRRPSGQDEWEEVPTGLTNDLYAIHGTSRDRLYAVGAGGVILRFVEGAWQRQRSTTGRDLFSVDVTETQVVAAGDFGTLVIADE